MCVCVDDVVGLRVEPCVCVLAYLRPGSGYFW